MEYKILFKIMETHLQFAEVVNAAIKEGWEPLGGVSIVMGTTQHTFYQAMIRRTA